MNIDGVRSSDGNQGFLTSLGDQNWEWLVNTRRAIDGLEWFVRVLCILDYHDNATVRTRRRICDKKQ